MTLRSLSAVLFVILTTSPDPLAAVLTFDDLPEPSPYSSLSGVITNGYGGLNWNNAIPNEGQGAAYYNTNVLRRWAYGVVSGDQAAYTYNSYGVNDIEMWGPVFTFNSAWFTAAAGPNQKVIVTGFNGTTLVGSQTIVLSNATPTWFRFTFGNVTKVVIDPGAYQVIIDDITINEGRQGPPDSDADGVPDGTDAFPHSRDVGANVTIDDCDTGVPSMLFPDGTTLSDLIYEIAAGAKNHGQFVRGVAELKNQFRKESLLTPGQAAAIESCAAGSKLP